MSEIRACTLVLEYNYSKPGTSFGSVWLLNGDGTSDLEGDESLEDLPQWVKIVGPIDYELAKTIHTALKKFFEQNSIDVIDKGIAD